MKVLMVCLGNICRSPLAEGILKKHLEKRGLDWTVDSAGIGAWHAGDLPHHSSRQVAKAHGVDISEQRGRQVRRSDFTEFDHILAMDSENLADLQRLAPEPGQQAKIQLILSHLEGESLRDVSDPYGRTLEHFEAVFQLLDRACQAFLEKQGGASVSVHP